MSEFKREPWMADAACKGLDPALFFPEPGNSAAAAKAVCAECQVRLNCFDYAQAEGLDDGIWGGTSARSRMAARRGTVPRGGFRPVPKCGTYAAYARHLRYDEEPCAPCRQANAEYQANAKARVKERATVPEFKPRSTVSEWRSKDDARRLGVVPS